MDPTESGGSQDPEYGLNIDWTASASTLAGAACLGALLSYYVSLRRGELAAASVQWANGIQLAVALTAVGYVVTRQLLFTTNNGKRVGSKSSSSPGGGRDSRWRGFGCSRVDPGQVVRLSRVGG